MSRVASKSTRRIRSVMSSTARARAHDVLDRDGTETHAFSGRNIGLRKVPHPHAVLKHVLRQRLGEHGELPQMLGKRWIAEVGACLAFVGTALCR
jgi:hypothetical protein